jgi:FG-GAP repeat
MKHRISTLGTWAVITLAPQALAQTPVRTYTGSAAWESFGAVVSPIGDLDGDGLPELAIGAPDHSSSRGRAEVHSGDVLNAGAVPLWENAGSSSNDWFGSSFSQVHDRDGDQIDELAVGIPGEGPGHVRVVPGQTILLGFGSPFMADYPGTYSNGHFGAAIVNLGDLDGDGADDFAIGAPLANVNATDDGAVHVVSGATGTELYPHLTGLAAGDEFGTSLATAGDVDSDGYEDFFVGAPGDSVGGLDAGAVHFFSGKTGAPIAGTWPLRTGAAGDRFGSALATGGDVDGDGTGDLAIGSPRAGATLGGRVSIFRISAITALIGQRGGDDGVRLGTSLSIAGDLDGDGHDDVLAGAPEASYDDTRDGLALVFSGADFGPTGTLLWSARGQGNDARFGHSLTFSPDITGDGLVELIVGAYRETTAGLGKAGRVSVYPNDGARVGTIYCVGDGSGTSCPCGNNFGYAESGCRSSAFGTGSQLRALGTASLARNDLSLHATESVPNEPGLFFQGNNAVNSGLGNPFGGGLRCAGGSVARIQTVVASASGDASSDAPIASLGGLSAGVTRRYQWWYRDPSSSCSGGFNLSNGLEITWVP